MSKLLEREVDNLNAALGLLAEKGINLYIEDEPGTIIEEFYYYEEEPNKVYARAAEEYRRIE